MSDRSDNGGPHNGTSNAQQGPGQNGSKGNPSGDTNAPHDSGHPDEPDTTMDSTSRSGKGVAASTPYMPQSGKLAGIVSHPPNEGDQRVDTDSEKHRLAGSSRWIPQAGKPTGNSSL